MIKIIFFSAIEFNSSSHPVETLDSQEYKLDQRGSQASLIVSTTSF
jgi:hypothetical protein